MSVGEVKKALANAELRERMGGNAVIHETGPSAFLIAGLEIEEMQ